MYDYRIVEINPSALLIAGHTPSSTKKYKVCKSIQESSYSTARSYLTEVPCGRCPVLAQCSENGIISPKSCEYFQEYLKNVVVKTDFDDVNVENTGTQSIAAHYAW